MNTTPTLPHGQPAATVSPAAIRLERDARGRLLFRSAADQPPVEGVRLARCFPWSQRDNCFSIRDADGKELCLLHSLEALEPDTRRCFEAELRVQEFVPRITTVLEIDDRFDVMAWKVETDHGPLELLVEHAEDVRPLANGGVLIKDHAGGLFEIPAVARLDPRSRELVEDHLP